MVQYGEPVRPVKEVEAVGMEVSPKGETIIDFGQNLAGVLRVKVDLPAGTKLILDHFETKDSQGNYFNNIAGADMTGHTQTDVYISNGKPAVWQRKYTSPGLRSSLPTIVTEVGARNIPCQSWVGVIFSKWDSATQVTPR